MRGEREGEGVMGGKEGGKEEEGEGGRGRGGKREGEREGREGGRGREGERETEIHVVQSCVYPLCCHPQPCPPALPPFSPTVQVWQPLVSGILQVTAYFLHTHTHTHTHTQHDVTSNTHTHTHSMMSHQTHTHSIMSHQTLQAGDVAR